MVIKPTAKIIATEIPMRFVYNYNHNTPQPPEYRKFRRSLNSKIESLKSKDYLLRLSGKNRLEQEKYLRDGVHYTYSGLDIFSDLIIKVIQYILDKENLSYQTSLSYPFLY